MPKNPLHPHALFHALHIAQLHEQPRGGLPHLHGPFTRSVGLGLLQQVHNQVLLVRRGFEQLVPDLGIINLKVLDETVQLASRILRDGQTTKSNTRKHDGQGGRVHEELSVQ